MRKYVTIPDIRSYPSYANVTARLLYFHVALSMDIASRTYAHSWRQLSADLDIPLQKIRTALAQLERDGLIATQKVTQQVTYGVTQKVTHKVTQIYILSVNDLDEPANEPANSPTNSQTNSQINSQTNSDNKNKNIPNSQNPTLTTARVAWAEKAAMAAQVLHIDAAEATRLTDEFKLRQELKQKTWAGDGDLLAHLISWCEKRISPGTLRAGRSRSTDSEARQSELSRTKKEQEAMTQQEKDYEECRKVYRWYQDYKRQKNKKAAQEMFEAYNELKEKYIQKYRQDDVQLQQQN